MSLVKSVYFFFDDVLDRLYVNRRKRSLTRYYKNSMMVRYVEPVLTDEEKREIDEYYLSNYGHKIDYRFHNTYKYYSGKFDVRYFPPVLAIRSLSVILIIIFFSLSLKRTFTISAEYTFGPFSSTVQIICAKPFFTS